ncbi:NAD(P)-dependent oxidoreductase [Nemorincola caseinilytica]|uniref:NAD(P)-dependent oxidoreductase n=1 Tax=Nemorincola caseinilytica TaxID=2054315 RepID=A0ABP8NRW5_9BACT
MIAYLGTGLLGSGFVRAMLAKGEQVRVWNRSAAKAQALAEYGAIVCATPAEAVQGASRIHMTLKDDASVNEVLQAALPGFAPGVVIADHTTTSVAGAIERTALWKEQGFTYVHAPVFMGPPNALESTGYMLVSGDQDVIAGLMPALQRMTGKVINFGPETGKAAGMKLAGNLFLIAFTAGISDTLSLTHSLGIPATDLMDLFNEWNPGAMLPARLKRMAGGVYDKPSWELDMARKDAGLMIAEAEKAGRPLAIIPAAAAEMDRWIARGYGNSDWTVIAKDNL